MTNERRFDWIDQAKAHGWEVPLQVTLDVLEPFGTLGAQVIYLLQPALGVLIPTEALHDIAEALESGDGINQLRTQLEADDNDPT